MLKQLVDYADRVTLVPQSGLQFLEFGWSVDTAPKTKRAFIERSSSGAGEDGADRFELLPNWKDGKPEDDAPHVAGPDDDEYELTRDKAVEAFTDVWFPVPFLRVEYGRPGSAEAKVSDGPFDWARARIQETRNSLGDKEATHRIVFAFDTALIEQKKNRPYLGLSPSDARGEKVFMFAHRPAHVGKFLSSIRGQDGEDAQDSQVWAVEWLASIFRAYNQRRRNRPWTDEDDEFRLEHLARYITLLEFLAEAVSVPDIALVDTISDQPRVAPIDVDLVLDVGNSRTCGILIQSFPSDTQHNLNQSLVLELRDLGNPLLSYPEPFESHVELVQAQFGSEEHAKRSGRARSFLWPSLVRLGAEAARYRAASEGTEAVTGLSSPKRYLWDERASTQTWQFREAGASRTEDTLIERLMRTNLNTAGDGLSYLSRLDSRARGVLKKRGQLDEEMSYANRFSRSSFFTFMLVEIVAQAMMQMNSPAGRRQDREKDTPRRLRSIVMTIPSATPVREQEILRKRAEMALDLLWDLAGWEGDIAPRKPAVHSNWDEASSMHLVYLYNEITEKMGGDIRAFFSMMGKPRSLTAAEGDVTPPMEDASASGPSLRIASVDIGGGTTDLMITTYIERENRAIEPTQNFREGFRQAGDDMMRQVIEAIVLPAIEKGLTEHGLADARHIMVDRFGADTARMSEADRHLRRQFVQRLLKPVALGILAACEDDTRPDRAVETRPFSSFFPQDDTIFARPTAVLNYLQDHARNHGAEGFSLGQVEIPIDPQLVGMAARTTFSAVFANIAEAVHKFDADIVLLTGRPSCLPCVVDLFREQLGVSVNRLVPVRSLRIGAWYPFRKPVEQLIDDPKTTAVVGGMLCTLVTANKLNNFKLYTRNLAMRSTVRFVGELEGDGRIRDDKLYFSEAEDGEEGRAADEVTRTLHSAVRLGYRQIAREDWIAAPIYRIAIDSGNRLQMPLTVSIARDEDDRDDDADAQAIAKAEAAGETFAITEAEDSEGQNVKRLMTLEFDTSTYGAEGLYWLDSGVLRVT